MLPIPQPERGVSLYLVGASGGRDLGKILTYSFSQDGQHKTVAEIREILRNIQDPTVIDVRSTAAMGEVEFHFSVNRYLPELGNLYVRYKDMIVFYYDESDENSLNETKILFANLRDSIFDKKVFFIGLREKNIEKSPLVGKAEKFVNYIKPMNVNMNITFLGSFSCEKLIEVREELCLDLRNIFREKYSYTTQVKHPEESVRVLDAFLQDTSSPSSSVSSAPHSTLFTSGGTQSQSLSSQPSQPSYNPSTTSSYGDSSSPDFEY